MLGITPGVQETNWVQQQRSSVDPMCRFQLDRGNRIGRRDLVDFRLEIQREVLGYLYKMRQEGVYTVTSKHLDMEQGGKRKGTRSIK